MKILVLDNYDSFVYNIAHYLEGMGCIVKVIRNDEVDLNRMLEYDRVVLSPGPGLPADAGLMNQIIQQYCDQIPMLGVCLGMQALVEFFGGQLVNLVEIVHGQATEIKIDSSESIYAGLNGKIKVGRYHSWGVYEKDMPADLNSTAKTQDGLVMSFRHKSRNLVGLQYHPESIMTPDGYEILRNWLEA